MRNLLVVLLFALLMAGGGKYTGLYTWSWPEGQKFGEVRFRNGKEHGLYKRWHRDGKKSIEGAYKNGKKHGVWTYYNLDGKYVLYRKTYKDGIEVDLTFF